MRIINLIVIAMIVLMITACSTAATKATLKTTGADYLKDQSHGPTETIVIEHNGVK